MGAEGLSKLEVRRQDLPVYSAQVFEDTDFRKRVVELGRAVAGL